MEFIYTIAVCLWFCNMVIFLFERWSGIPFGIKACLRLLGIVVPPLGVVMCFTKWEV